MTSVYISNENIQVVIGKKSGKKLRIKRIVTEPVAENCIINGLITDDAALKSQIARMWKTHKLPKKDIKLVIESSSVNTKSIVLPNNAKQEYMIKLIADNFPEADDGTVVYDYMPLYASQDGGISVLGCMAERSFIKSYVELFESSGFKLAAIDIAICGLIRMSAFCKSLSSKTFILSVIDKNTVTQFLFIDGQYRFSNRHRIINDRDTPEMADELVGIISSFIQFNRSEKSGAEITNVYFCGYSETEINSADINFGGGVEFGKLPEMEEILMPENTSSRKRIADFAISVGNLI